jgi:aldose sugar dehydrogenase
VLLVQPALAQEAPRSPTPAPIKLAATVTDVARGLEHPWGVGLLPDGRFLVTERPGRLRLVSAGGQLSEPLTGVPEVYARGQGGLLDVALSPGFAQDKLVYLSFSEPGPGGAGTAVARGRLGERGLEGTQVIWRQQPKVDGPNHWGSRLVFRPDGTLFVTLGDRFAYRDRAQDLSTTLGKVVRINPDGSVPRDNPFVDGARGGDELNNPQPGKNYGWPVITYGVDYSGARIGVGTSQPGMEQPVCYWDPVIAPSGATFYSGAAFADWKGDLLVGSLTPGGLVRLRITNGRVVREERYLAELRERIRDVREGPDGAIYLLTDDRNGRLLRVTPSSRSTSSLGLGSAIHEKSCLRE